MSKKNWSYLGLFILLLIIVIVGLDFMFHQSVLKENQNTIQEKDVNNSGKQPLTEFYIRGSFVANPPINIDGYEVIIFAATVENVFEDFNNPQYFDPQIYVRLIDTQNEYKDYYSKIPIIKNNKFKFDSIETPLGVFKFEGVLVDKQGQSWIKMNAINYETILKGTIILEKDGETKYSRLVNIPYWDGSGD